MDTLFTKEKKPPNPNASKPIDIRTFQITFQHLPSGPPSPSQPHTNPLSLSLAFSLTLSIDPSDPTIPYLQYKYVLLHPEEIDLDENLHPVFQEISIHTPDDPAKSVDPERNHFFRFDTRIKDGQETLRQLIDLGVLELVPAIGISDELDPGEGLPTAQPTESTTTSEYPLVHIKLSGKELAKQCGACQIWEQRTDQERLSLCSRCRMAWWCDEDCQILGWKRGQPIPHKKVCQTLSKQGSGVLSREVKNNVDPIE